MNNYSLLKSLCIYQKIESNCIWNSIWLLKREGSVCSHKFSQQQCKDYIRLNCANICCLNMNLTVSHMLAPWHISLHFTLLVSLFTRCCMWCSLACKVIKRQQKRIYHNLETSTWSKVFKYPQISLNQGLLKEKCQMQNTVLVENQVSHPGIC